MKKKILIRCAIGAVLGLLTMYLVPPILNQGSFNRIVYTDALLSRVGSPAAATAVTLLVMALFGALCMGGTLFYEVERWSLAQATAAHYLAISLGYVAVNRLLWNIPTRLLLIIEGVMTLGFILIWLIMYLSYRKEVRALNELIRRTGSDEESKQP